MVDAPASGAGDRKVVEVRVLFWAPFLVTIGNGGASCFPPLRAALFKAAIGFGMRILSSLTVMLLIVRLHRRDVWRSFSIMSRARSVALQIFGRVR